MRWLALPLCLATLIGGCADTSGVSRAFVTPNKYDHLECKQLASGLAAIKSQLEKTDGLYERGGIGIGAVVYGPDLMRLRGERTRYEEAMAKKNCPAE